MSYLENGICNFKLIGRSKIHKNGVNIISITFFKMPKFYKNFYIYINGLKNWIKILEELKSNFVIRLFIDQNIYEDQSIMKIINSSKYIEPVLFLCADYVLDKYHIDLFSTLIRFFPFFNFKNNDALSILSADIDLIINNEYHTVFYKYIITHYKNIKEITIFSNLYEYYFRDKDPYIQAGLLFLPENKKYNKKIILDFIQFEDKLKFFNKYVDRKNTGLSLNKLKIDFLNSNKNSKFLLGIDEIFLNEYLKITNTNKLNVVILQNFNHLLYYLIFFNKSTSYQIIINNKNYSKEFEESIYKITQKKISLKNYFEQTDKILYLDKKSDVKLCLNHKYKNCFIDSDSKEKIIKNIELRNVLNNFKNKIPEDSNIFQILNSGLLKLNNYAYLLNVEFKKINKNLKFQNFNVIYKTKK